MNRRGSCDRVADYRITFARSARKELEGLERAILARIWPRIEHLSAEPRPAGCVKLVGMRSLWRIRVGEYRVIYALDDKQRIVDVIAVRHRREAYH